MKKAAKSICMFFPYKKLLASSRNFSYNWKTTNVCHVQKQPIFKKFWDCVFIKNDPPPQSIQSQTRKYHSSSSSNSQNSGSTQCLKLMNFNELVFPNPLKSLRNYFLAILIRTYYDKQFTLGGFLLGAEQAITRVSSSISCGEFDALDGLVSQEAVKEIQQNYQLLSPEQKMFIKVNPKDITFKAVYEIGMIFDESSHRKYVEITTIIQGFHGFDQMKSDSIEDVTKEMFGAPEQLYVCNYRFIREISKDIEDAWIINKLNHFVPVKK